MTSGARERTVTLDGLGWRVREAGPQDGRVLVYFHGTPSCRLEPAFADLLVEERGVRLVSFDRPGYGASDPAPFSLASLARDTGRLADELGIATFATTGQSGGGPFSLACGAVLGGRVTRVGVTSGAAPFDRVPELLALLDENDRAAYALLPDGEAAMRQFAVGFEPLRALPDLDPELVRAELRALMPGDVAVIDRPDMGPLVPAMQGALVQGCEGAGWDNVAWVGPWDVELEDVRQPVFLWYGAHDPMAVPPTGQWLAEHLPDARLDFREEEGHLGALGRFDEVLAALCGD